MGPYGYETTINEVYLRVHFQNYTTFPHQRTQLPTKFQIVVQDFKGGNGSGFIYFRDHWIVEPDEKRPGILKEMAPAIIERLILYFE